MELNKNRYGVITFTGMVAFFLAIAPILDPYVAVEIGTEFTIKLNDILMLLIGILCFSRFKNNNFKSNYLCILVIGLALISILANIYNGTSISGSLKNIIVWFVYALFLMYIWRTPCKDKFLYWVEIIAVVAAVVIILQFISGYIGVPMWDGKLPIGELGKYDQWSGYIDRNTGDIRPNGIFQEASYAGIYLSVAYVQALRNGRIKRAVLYAVAMLTTTSMIAVVMCIVLTLYIVFIGRAHDISKKIRIRILIGIIIAVLVLIYLINTNESVYQSFAYIVGRLNNFNLDLTGERMSSTRFRLLGHIYLFDRYSVIQKVFGVGVGQYSIFFDVSSYSNVWVTTILNSGIVGVIFLAISLLGIFKNISSENRIYFVILLIVISTDYQWFSWYFFYLLSACILENKRKTSFDTYQTIDKINYSLEGRL